MGIAAKELANSGREEIRRTRPGPFLVRALDSVDRGWSPTAQDRPGGSRQTSTGVLSSRGPSVRLAASPGLWRGFPVSRLPQRSESSNISRQIGSGLSVASAVPVAVLYSLSPRFQNIT